MEVISHSLGVGDMDRVVCTFHPDRQVEVIERKARASEATPLIADRWWWRVFFPEWEIEVMRPFSLPKAVAR